MRAEGRQNQAFPLRNSLGTLVPVSHSWNPRGKGGGRLDTLSFPTSAVVGTDQLSPDTNFFLFLCLQDSKLLTFNLSGHRSWWEEHGPGCLHEEAATAGLGTLHGQSLVVGTGCAMVHSYVEVLHSGLQILLAVSVGSGTQAGGLFYLGQSQAFPSHRGTSFPLC